MIKTDLLSEALIKYDIFLSQKQITQFVNFEKLLKEYNSHTNLVSSNDMLLIWEKHIIDSIAFCHYLKNDFSGKILDIGSGGGFPAIPEAIILQQANIFALDSTSKKIKFLQSAAETLELKNFTAINDRAEDLSHKKTYRENFDVVSSRAVGNLAQISELALPFLKINGHFIAYKATKLEEELKLAQKTIINLGGEVEDIFEYNLKLNENFRRNLVLIKKINNTPSEYPRSFSAIKNKPL